MKCYVCGAEDSVEEHHLIPRARGGTKGWTIQLCAVCHSKAHKLALAKKLLKIENSRLNSVVLILKKSETLEHAGHYKVTLKVPNKLYFLIKADVKKKSKLSIPKVILGILFQYYMRRS